MDLTKLFWCKEIVHHLHTDPSQRCSYLGLASWSFCHTREGGSDHLVLKITQAYAHPQLSLQSRQKKILQL